MTNQFKIIFLSAATLLVLSSLCSADIGDQPVSGQPLLRMIDAPGLEGTQFQCTIFTDKVVTYTITESQGFVKTIAFKIDDKTMQLIDQVRSGPDLEPIATFSGESVLSYGIALTSTANGPIVPSVNQNGQARLVKNIKLILQGKTAEISAISEVDALVSFIDSTCSRTNGVPSPPWSPAHQH